MNDAEKIMLAGFSAEMEKDAAAPAFLKNIFSKGKGAFNAFKSGISGKKTTALSGAGSKTNQKAFDFGRLLNKNKKEIGIGSGAALGGAGLNEIFSD